VYEACEKAFVDWLKSTHQENASTGERDALKRAFFAGWKARKAAQYKSIV
jgi:hypothetical protein